MNDVAGTRGYEHQVSLRVDPANARHLVSVWTQEFDDGTVMATSRDGGAHWNAVGVPGQTPGCGDENSAYDTAENPRAAVGPDGAVYVVSNLSTSSTSASNVTGPSNPSVRVNVTRDDGRTWVGSKTLETSPSLDWVWVAADPTIAGTAYVLWGHREVDAQGSVTAAWEYVSRTTNWGADWKLMDEHSYPRPPDGRTYQWGQLFVRADHTLVEVFSECTPSDQCTGDGVTTPGMSSLRVATSVDGSSWSNVRAGDDLGAWVDAASEGDQLLAVSAVDGRIVLDRSRDLGQTWSGPVDVLTGGFYYDVAVAIAGNTIAVFFYEVRSIDPLGAVSGTVLRVASSRDGKTWNVTDVAGPFDDRGPPGGHGMGEWIGAVSTGAAVACTFPTGPSKTSDSSQAVVDGPTDVFFASVPVR